MSHSRRGGSFGLQTHINGLWSCGIFLFGTAVGISADVGSVTAFSVSAFNLGASVAEKATPLLAR